jgi:hypothetical protein
MDYSHNVQEASITRNRKKNDTVRNGMKNKIIPQVSLKRKVGYSEDEVAEARERISRMRLD